MLLLQERTWLAKPTGTIQSVYQTGYPLSPRLLLTILEVEDCLRAK